MSSFDVVVVGGGTAGVAAAVAAARQGARTLLVERYGFLGGTLTAGLVGPMMSFHSPTRQVIQGIAQELVERMQARGGCAGHIFDTSGYVPTVTPYDTEVFKITALEMLLEAGCELSLHSWLRDVQVAGNRLVSLEVQDFQGTTAVEPQVVIDATGDGHVAHLAGVPMEVGRKEDGRVQPASLMFKMDGVDTSAIKAYAAKHPDQFRLGSTGVQGLIDAELVAVCGFYDLVKEARKAGKITVDRDVLLFFNTPYPDQVIVNMSRIPAPTDFAAQSWTAAEVTLRKQVAELVRFLNREVPGFAQARLTATGCQIGLRESRRIVGLYQLTDADIISGRFFDDAIACSAYPIDVHSPDGDTVETLNLGECDYYTIPYRSLLNKRVENLLCAGRCISTTHLAHAATRVSPTCMAVGEAAGTAAALATKDKTSPHSLSVSLLRDTLRSQGAFVGAES